MTTEHDLASLLPASLADRLEHVGTDAPPESGVGHGLAGAVRSGPVDIGRAPHLWTAPTLRNIPAGTVMRWQPEPTTVLVDAPAPPTVLVGEPFVRDGSVLQLDARDARFVLLFRLDDRDVVLDVRPGGAIEEFVASREDEPSFALQPHSDVPLTLPPYDPTPLAPLGLEPWLLTRAAARAARDDRGPAVAVGLVLRLGRPAPDRRRAEIDRLRRGEEASTRAWARIWLARVAPPQRIELEARLRETANRLLAALDRLGDDVLGELDEDEVVSLVEDRDDIESGRRLLELDEGGATLLVATLRAVDRRALEVGAALADGFPEDEVDLEWRDAVAWQEPEAWWARLGPE